jgi:hypothetical protein
MLNYLLLLVKNKKTSQRMEGYESIPILMKIILKKGGNLMWNSGWIAILDIWYFRSLQFRDEGRSMSLKPNPLGNHHNS